MAILQPKDVVSPKPWEGKPFPQIFKHWYANYPGIVFAVALLGAAPFVLAYQLYNMENDPIEAAQKYKMYYAVVRPDDPNIEKIKMMKEYRRDLFPEK